MATTSNILTLLKFYSSKQKSPMIEYGEFGEYIHRYAQHHLEENSDLVMYCGSNYDDSLSNELNDLVAQKQIAMGTIRNKEYIFVTAFFIEKYLEILKQIETNPLVPFPCVYDIPKNVPMEILTKQPAADIIYRLLDKQEINDKTLYSIIFDKNVPALLFPSSFPMDQLVSLALRKIQEHLKKEEAHDYFQKKLCVSNPGKEISIKAFFSQFCSNPIQALDQLKTSGDTFYYWSQMCYFLRQDYTKMKDFTPEDISILQAVSVTEIATSYYKTKTTERLQKESALKTLDTLMLNAPYYFNYEEITKIKDQSGILLLGQYTEEDLQKHLSEMSTETVGNQMPDLLIFKVEDTSYYIRKEKVMPLIIRLANDSRTLVREGLTKIWYRKMLEFETLPEMRETPAFERCLEREVKASNPVLYGILNASFLPVVAFEDQTPGRIALFRNNALIPYSELLMISRQEIYSDAKIKLPLWYTLPLISWIMSLILRKPKKNSQPKKEKAATTKISEEKKAEEKEEFRKKNDEDAVDAKNNRKRELRKAAASAESYYVPDNSSLDRELAGYLKEWNDRIGKENYDNLTEDINSLIRDYLRKILRTLKSEGFTPERISSLAESLISSPSMMRLKNHAALKRYVELYLVKLVKNLP